MDGETTPSGVVGVGRSGAVLRLVLARPDRLNALGTAALDELAQQIDRAAFDDRIRVVTLTGEGRAFCSGADLGTAVDAGTVEAANRAVLALRRIGKPVVAAVNGAAVGVGCSLALACDLVIARCSAYFLLALCRRGPHARRRGDRARSGGRGPGAGDAHAMLGERISAGTAFDWGLIGMVVDDDAFDATVESVTARLADGPPLAHERTKHALNAAVLPDLTRALETERAGQGELLRTQDFSEGVAAFRDHRRPKFTGR